MDPEPNLPGEDAETPAAPPAETTTPDDGTSASPGGAANLSPEEERWNALAGSSQERFRRMAADNNQLRREREELQQKLNSASYQPPVTASDTKTPEVESAVRRLSQVGIATKDEVQQAIDQRLAGLVYQQELTRLEDRYSGEDGRPKFDREEYEDYVSRHPQYRNYAPEDVYQKMYEPELFEWRVQSTGKHEPAKAVPSLKPTKTQVREEPLTPELIEQRLNEPDGRKWYEEHRSQIQTVLSKTATPTW